jgi:hypothetical protein
MKIVFVASHSQKQELGKYYQRINDYLVDQSHTVYSGSLFVLEKSEDIKNLSMREKWYKESISEIHKADLVVVEISYPSTANVGHLLTQALDLGKTVLALYHDGRSPLFLSGRNDDRLLISSYSDMDLEQVIKSGMEYMVSVQDVRFNFFISPSIGRYLDWVSKNKRIPRAVYLRKLIEEEMKNNSEYSESK